METNKAQPDFTIIVKANKTWSLYLIVVGLFMSVYAPFALRHQRTFLIVIFLLLGIYVIIEGFIVLRASIMVSGMMLTSTFLRSKQVDMSKLTSITPWAFSGIGGENIKLTDSLGNSVVLSTRLYRSKDMATVLGIVRPHFPIEPASLSWIMRNSLKRYGIR